VRQEGDANDGGDDRDGGDDYEHKRDVERTVQDSLLSRNSACAAFRHGHT
jgi:hypothetical protein